MIVKNTRKRAHSGHRFHGVSAMMLLCLSSFCVMSTVAFSPRLSSGLAARTMEQRQRQQQNLQQEHYPSSVAINTGRHPRTLLRKSLDDDDGDDDVDLLTAEDGVDEEDFSFAPVESFESEADVASAANELAAETGGSKVELQKEIETSFLQYALSIILGRALPDARDGLKPVHRRILYAMHQLSLSPSGPHRKCARVVGEVLGKYHPHGDMAVYDALVRMAQDFTTNYRLIDGHGNFGSVDADPAAAMRYTECRLTHLATNALLADINDDTVDFNANFDGNEVEPNVLPTKLPLLLLNGSSGIAVGMATNIPPHNLREVMNACIALVEGRMDPTKEISDDQLFRIVPSPDFPTGAYIMGTDGAKQLYSTGNGGIVMRAVTNIEQLAKKGKGQARTAIIVTELPYQVNKAALLEKIAGLVNDKKLEGISDLRDESDREGIRVVLELKRDAIPDVVLNNLYKKTSLQTSFSGNFLALMDTKDDGSSLTPQRFTLREALDCFLNFRFKTIRRKTSYQLNKVENRAHIVAGLLKALARVDEVIEVVRSSPDQKTAKLRVIEEGGFLELSEEQADAVLRLQLGQLTRLNGDKLKAEAEDLQRQAKDLKRLLDVDNAVYDVIINESKELDAKYGEERKSRIQTDGGGEVDELDMIKNSRSVIVMTRGGYIKRMPLKTFERQNRGTRGKRGTSSTGNSSDDEVAHCFTCNDHDTLLMVSQSGIAYGLRAYRVPVAGRVAKGQPIPSVLPIRMDDTITSIMPVDDFADDEYVILTTEKGWIKKTPLKAFEKINNRGLTIARLEPGDRLKYSKHCRDGDDILMGTTCGKATRFSSADVRPTKRSSRGVRAMRLREGDTIADMNVVTGRNDEPPNGATAPDGEEYVMCITAAGYGKRTRTSDFNTKQRGGMGVLALKFNAKREGEDRVQSFCVVSGDDEVLLITAQGVMVRQKVSSIPIQGRAATGVLVQKVDEGDSISSISLVPKSAYEDSDD